jgi:hypothetical protein
MSKLKTLIIFMLFIGVKANACSFPDIYIHHYAFPVTTDADGGPSTWFNPLIKGQYDGCYLGISDSHTFTMAVGQTHSVELYQYYAVLAATPQVCEPKVMNIYGADSPVTGRYETMCAEYNQNPTQNSPPPAICIVYENVVFSALFSNCINNMSFNNKLNCMDNPMSCTLPNIEDCKSDLNGGIAGCFPYPLPPSPPPFCDSVTIPPQTPSFIPICDQANSIASVCGQQTSTGDSTYSKPCARVTFNNYAQVNTASISSPESSLIPTCTTSQQGSICVNNCGELCNPPTNPILAQKSQVIPIDQNAITLFGNTGYVEAIYTDSNNNPTRWYTSKNPLSFYGYNFAPFQDICFDFSSNTPELTQGFYDNYGNARTFRSCLPPICTTPSTSTTPGLPAGCVSQPINSFCIEEITGQSPSDYSCNIDNNPFCFNRPQPQPPEVTFCPNNLANNIMINNQTNYCLQATFDGNTYTFTPANNKYSQLTAIESDNNFNMPTGNNTCSYNGNNSTCYPYYTTGNITYEGTGNGPFYGGLIYSGQTYQTGATKYCITGYTSTSQQDIVCNISSDPDFAANGTASQQINYRGQPTPSTKSPLNSAGECCDPTSSLANGCIAYGGTEQNPAIFRTMNPLELGLCVDIMPYQFIQSCQFPSSQSVTPQQATQLTSDCNNYVNFCSQTNSTSTFGGNIYINADICNENFIDCSINSSTNPPNQPTSITSNVCQFYQLSKNNN